MSKSVKPVPDGYHTVTPYLVVQDAARAIDFYTKAFGAQEICRMPAPDGKKVMHAEVQIGTSRVMLADEFPEGGWLAPQNGTSPVTIHLYVEDADATFNQAVSAGAQVRMPLADTFWGDRFGTITDPFGHSWSIATHKEDLTPE
ncbi:MAG TPA: VOC family protein, partial [Verrucomicrobiota bacterium]|nr:VOC family protein [Verrucomicrobiota bacterium]